MRHEDISTAVAIAAPMPFGPRSNFVDATRSILTVAPGTTTDAGAAIMYGLVFWTLLVFDAVRARVARFIGASIHGARRAL